MKSQDIKNNSNGHQGNSTADRAFARAKQVQKSQGVNNAGSQHSNQTSSRDGAHQPQKKKD